MKLLILRFSSFGDIVQCMSVLAPLKKMHPSIEISWATNKEFRPVIALSDSIKACDILCLAKKSGLIGLCHLAKSIKKVSPDIIYDAHQTPRTFILIWLLRLYLLKFKLIKRKKERLRRWLLFFARINLFPKPYRGMLSYGAPLVQHKILSENWHENIKLTKWNFTEDDGQMVLQQVQNLSEYIALIPSAAWEMKRWPPAYWQNLIERMPNQKFIILGGPADHFCEKFVIKNSSRVLNFAGKLSLRQSCFVVANVKKTISADTGLIHVSDILQKEGVCLMGPTAFGFTTSPKIIILETEMSCRPCSKDGRGRCSQKIYQKCMVDITPEKVEQSITF